MNKKVRLLPLAQLLSAHAAGAGGLGSNPGLVKLAECWQRLATDAIDGPRHS